MGGCARGLPRMGGFGETVKSEKLRVQSEKGKGVKNMPTRKAVGMVPGGCCLRIKCGWIGRPAPFGIDSFPRIIA